MKEEINELKKSNISKEHKVTANIQIQDEITEEKNSYKERYEKQHKEILE